MPLTLIHLKLVSWSNEKGMPVDIVVRERGTAERMIESFMLAANECVAEHFAKAKLPFIYRIHEEPKAEKLQRFMDYAIYLWCSNQRNCQ